MFERLKLLVGEENFHNVQNKKVMIIGIGGVGGECAISLVRSGINKIVIIDNDVVELSNINRQAIAFHSTVGKKKVEVLRKILMDINPDVDVSSYNLFLDKDNIKSIIEVENPHYIIDCCDTVNTKKAIIKESIEKNIKFITSMGTGNKLDPSQLEITEIKKTENCPLAKVIRKWARDEEIKSKIPVLYSKELPLYRGEVISSSSFVPNSAGLLLASYVFRDLLKEENML